MKRYLIIGHWKADVVQTDQITKDDLVEMVKHRAYDQIIDLENGTFFDGENNRWVEVQEK